MQNKKEISIIIPVYKEKNLDIFLHHLIASIKNISYEIILVDYNNSSNINDINIKDIIKVHSQKGRAKQMNEGAKFSSACALLFLHCDTRLPINAFLEIKNILKQDIVAGAFDLSFNSNNIFLKFIAFVASYRSRLTQIPYGDQAIFIKKDIFYKINMYDNIDLMEDINLMQKLKKHKYKIKILNSKVITSARAWQDKGILYTTLRNWVLVSLYYLGKDANKLARFYK